MPRQDTVATQLAELLEAEGLEHERPEPHRFVIVLPGRAKLRTTVSMAGSGASTISCRPSSFRLTRIIFLERSSCSMRSTRVSC